MEKESERLYQDSNEVVFLGAPIDTNRLRLHSRLLVLLPVPVISMVSVTLD